MTQGLTSGIVHFVTLVAESLSSCHSQGSQYISAEYPWKTYRKPALNFFWTILHKHWQTTCLCFIEIDFLHGWHHLYIGSVVIVKPRALMFSPSCLFAPPSPHSPTPLQKQFYPFLWTQLKTDLMKLGIRKLIQKH